MNVKGGAGLRLVFKKKYLSIDQFNTIELPNFVVLTGENGSGKSHLLEAIEKRDVVIEMMEDAHIVLFNYETFRLDNENALNSEQISNERSNAWAMYTQNVKAQAQGWRSELGSDYEKIKDTCINEGKSLWELDDDRLKSYKKKAQQYCLNKKRQPQQQQQLQSIYSLLKQLPYSIDEIEEDEFRRLYKPILLKNDFLPAQLGKVFWDYWLKLFHNLSNQLLNERFGANLRTRPDDEFISMHGTPPWDAVNEILRSFDTLKYQVTTPIGVDVFSNFQLKLKHTEINNLEIQFSDLSSGERVMMALVASIYKASADRHFPDVLLLDEVDASLHPSMMKNMLNVIERVFLKQGVKVILITHSPTTLALAPEESIYIMNRSGRNRIEKKPRTEALSILTQGFATIEEGLKLFDEVAKTQLTIFTEGHNQKIIEKALELYGISDVAVVRGIEGISGETQLATLFHFFTKMQHANKVLFVWDCDSKPKVEEENNTFKFIIPKNLDNSLAPKGIENAFPKEIFSGFIKTVSITYSTGHNSTVKEDFDENRKKDFCEFVVGRNQKTDFANFSSLIEKIKQIKDI